MSSPSGLEIGSKIRQARKRKGLTIEGLARAVGVSWRTVSRWEANDSTPSLAKLEQIAAELCEPIGFFVEERRAA